VKPILVSVNIRAAKIDGEFKAKYCQNKEPFILICDEEVPLMHNLLSGATVE